MASIGGNDLGIEDDANVAGAAFRMAMAAAEKQVIAESQGYQVHTSKDSQYIIVTLQQDYQPSKLLQTSHELAQQGLDLLSVQGLGDYTIASGNDECVIWWRDNGQIRLRYHAVTEQHFTLPLIAGQGIDAQGNVVPPTPAAVPEWHPAFRYYRLSQTTDDLYESYRNLYLTFEAILSDYLPAANHAGDRKPPGDTEWTRQALQSIKQDGVDLTPFVSHASNDIVNALIEEQYKAHRCALFHAKVDKKPLLPGFLEDRKSVLMAHDKLSGLVVRLLSHRFGVWHRTGFISPYFFSTLIQSIANDVQLGVCGEQEVEDARIDTPAGERSSVWFMQTKYRGAIDENKIGTEHEFGGMVEVSRLPSLLINTLIVRRSSDDTGDYASIDRLTLEGVDILEVRLALVMNNRRMSKRLFSF